MGGISGSFSMFFPETSGFCDENKTEINFAALYFCLHDLKKYISK